METWRDVPDFAMAVTGSPVATRVARLLGISQQQNGARTAGVVTASLALATALIAAGISFGIANPALAQSAGGSFQQLVPQVDQAPSVTQFAHVVEAEEDVEEVVSAEVAQEVDDVQTVEEEQKVEIDASEEPTASKPPRAPVAPKEPVPARARGAGETCKARFSRIAAESARSPERTFLHQRNEFGGARESRRR